MNGLLRCTTAIVLFALLWAGPARSAEEVRPHSYLQLGLGVALYDHTLRTWPDALGGAEGDEAQRVGYRRAFGVNLRGAWQGAHGLFLYADYFAADGCVDDCLSDGERHGSSSAFERYTYGVGAARQWDDLHLFMTGALERHTFELCSGDDRELACTRDRRRGYSVGVGLHAELGEAVRWTTHYERYGHDLRDPDNRLLPLGNGRLTTTLSTAVDRSGRIHGYFQHLFERNQSFHFGVRFYH